MKIAVVGAGISGLSCAYLLAPHAHVTLYEKERVLGGHAHTAEVMFGDTKVNVDTGFMVLNPGQYPYLLALFKELSVQTVPTDMSFAVSIPGAVEYSSNLLGLFGDLKQLANLRYWRVLADIIRFNVSAKRFLQESKPDRSLLLRTFLEQQTFSAEFRNWYLFPMLGSIWSTPTGALEEYNAYATFRFLDNHRLLNVLNKPRWQTVKDGSSTYVRVLQKKLEQEGVRIRTDVSPVVERNGSGVNVKVSETIEVFDTCIIATHADSALSIVQDMDASERATLEGFSYSENAVILHSDPSFMPRSERVWASWNYVKQQNERGISLTYNMNSLQSIPTEFPLFVTLNPEREPSADLIHNRYTYAHPVFDNRALQAQEKIRTIQGLRNTYYAGAHLGAGFHEDGIVSAVEVTKKLGFPVRLTP